MAHERLEMGTGLALGLIAALFLGCGGGATTNGEPGGDGSSPSGLMDGGGTAAPAGLAAYCKLYEQCGGSYYASEAECVSKTDSWYGICAGSEAALNAYGDCMVASVTCTSWNPNADPPGTVACGDEWQALQRARRVQVIEVAMPFARLVLRVAMLGSLACAFACNHDAGTPSRDDASAPSDASTAVDANDLLDASAIPDGATSPVGDASSAGDAATVPTDPFDPATCVGTTMSRATALSLIGQGNLGSFIGQSNTPLYMRTRTCPAATGCGPWSAPVIASDGMQQVLLHATLSLDSGTDPNATVYFSLLDSAATSPTKDANCPLMTGAATEADCTRMLVGGVPGWFFCKDPPLSGCPSFEGTFSATVTEHCARFHGGTQTIEYALAITY